MGMSIIKNLYLNYHNKLHRLTNKIFYNLNSRKCESFYTILLSFNINVMEPNKISSTTHDDDCYIVSDSVINRNNNENISTAVFETTATASSCVSGCSSNNPPGVHANRRRIRRNDEESISIRQNNYENPNTSISMLNTPCNIALNSCLTHLINSHLFYQSRGLSLRNVVSPICHEQLSPYTTQRFRNASLFSEQDSISSKRNFSNGSHNLEEHRDKVAVNNLRMWVPINDNLNLKPGQQFTLLSYNVLAQDLLIEHEYLYRNHKRRALIWKNRWSVLYNEILENNPDIICLQEVQEDHLQDYFYQFLNNGYAHLYKKKTGMRTDGCAIFYKKNEFKLIENITVEYNQNQFVLNRDNIAIIAKFAAIHNPNAKLVVATTHLLYNPKREDVRLAQSQLLFSEIDRMAYTGNASNKYYPIIVTGDFNTEPGSAVHTFITSGTLQYENLAKRTLKTTNATENMMGKVLIPSSLHITDNCHHLEINEQRAAGKVLTRAEESQLINIQHSRRKTRRNETEVDDKILFSTGVLKHDLKLKSVFTHKTGNDTEGTTFQNKWITVDYIFYSENLQGCKLKLISKYTIPTSTDLSKKVRHIPNFALGSDHLALLAKFNLEY